jgi:hypothetical protein
MKKLTALILTLLLCLTAVSGYSSTATLTFGIEKTNYVYVEGQPIETINQSYNNTYNNDSDNRSSYVSPISRIVGLFGKWYIWNKNTE